MLLGLTTPAFASQTPPTQQAPQTTTQDPPPQTTPSIPTPDTPPATTTTPAPEKATDRAGDDKDRIFGVLPNYTSVTGNDKFMPISGKESIKIAALDSVMDPMVYPLYGFVDTRRTLLGAILRPIATLMPPSSSANRSSSSPISASVFVSSFAPSSTANIQCHGTAPVPTAIHTSSAKHAVSV